MVHSTATAFKTVLKELEALPYMNGDSRGWGRSSSLRKHLSKRSFSSSRIDQVGGGDDARTKENDVTIVTEDRDGDSLIQNSDVGAGGGSGGERGVDVGRVGAWATDFEKLLADPVGLQTFTEFLKKEFSAENILFWISCEKYRRLTDQAERQEMAADIMEKHLSQGASDPVNVDSHARQAAQEGMANPSPSLFAAAQKQIYNLMKFDSFSRFLKSDLYKEAMVAEMSGRPLPFADDAAVHDNGLSIDLNSNDNHVLAENNNPSKISAVKKQEESSNRRKSLLPWGNLKASKDRSKSKERTSFLATTKSKEEEQQLQHQHQQQVEPAGGACTLARVILPDSATTVVQTRKGETVRTMVSRLLEKRGLRFTSFDVFAAGADRPMDLSADCSALGCVEVRVEPRVLFRLELPSKKSIGVKAKPAKVARDVLGPILAQYGWRLDAVTVRKDDGSDTCDVNLEATVADIDNSRLVVAEDSQEDARSWRSSSSRGSEIGSSRYLTSVATDDEKLAMPPPLKIPPKKQQSKSNVQKSEKPAGVTEDLYEGLKLAQRGRLDDQRGTEINFEMPDFLKRSQDKENYPYSRSPLTHRQSEPILQRTSIGHHHLRRDVFPPLPLPSHHPSYDRLSSLDYYSRISEHEYTQPYSLHHFPTPQHQQQSRRDSFLMRNAANESTFSHDGYLPTALEADRLFGVGNESTISMGNESRLSLGMMHPHHQRRMLPRTPTTASDAVYETLSHYHSGWSAQQVDPAMLLHRREPPPLPPKPRLSMMTARPSSEADLPRPPPQHHHHQQYHQRHRPSGGGGGGGGSSSRHSDAGGAQRGYSVSFV